MALEAFIEEQLRTVERFLADPEAVALEIQRAPDLAIMAAKVIVAGQDDADGRDAYVGFDQPYEGPEPWCLAVAEAVMASLAAAAEELAAQGIEVELPAGIDQQPGRSRVPIEARLLEYLETVARALSPWLRSVVLLWDPGEPLDEPTRREWIAFASRVLAATGSRHVKWIVFSEPGTALLTSLIPERRRIQGWAAVAARHGASTGLPRFVADPLARVLTYRGDERAYQWFRGQFVSGAQLHAGQTLVLEVREHAFLRAQWYYRVAALTIARQLRELERPIAARRPEQEFAATLEQMLDALVAPATPVVVILAPDARAPAEGLDASLHTLAEACARPEVSIICIDPRLPEAGLSRPQQAVACQRFDLDQSKIAAGLRAVIADPELPDAARVPYLSALAGLAIGEGDPQRSLERAVAAVGAARELGNPEQLAVAQYVLGNSLYHATGFTLAEQAYAESVELSIEHNLASLAAQAMLGLGNCCFMQQKFEGARSCYEAARTYYSKLGNALGQVQALTWMGEAAAREQQWAQSRADFERGVALCDALDPSHAQMRDSSKAELLQRLARLFDVAGMRTEAAQRRAQARALGAVVEPESIPS